MGSPRPRSCFLSQSGSDTESVLERGILLILRSRCCGINKSVYVASMVHYSRSTKTRKWRRTLPGQVLSAGSGAQM